MNPATPHIPCHQCGSHVKAVELKPGEALRCGLCRFIVKRKRRSDSFQPVCSFAISGLLCLGLANVYPIMTFNVAGNTQQNEIVTGVGVLLAQGYWPVALLVFFCAMLAPFLYFAGVAYVSAACMIPGGLPLAMHLLGVVRAVQPWSLVPVFAAACLVAVVKLDLIGTVSWQSGIGWIALLAGCTLALGSLFDPELAASVLKQKKTKP